MKVGLTKEQMEVMKETVRICTAFTDQLYHIMKNHGLDKVNGFQIRMEVDPFAKYITRMVEVGTIGTEAGYIGLKRGKDDREYAPYITEGNTPEYIRLFTNEGKAGRKPERSSSEKPLPPDGLWVSSDRYDRPVDSREWDINDSLS